MSNIEKEKKSGVCKNSKCKCKCKRKKDELIKIKLSGNENEKEIVKKDFSKIVEKNEVSRIDSEFSKNCMKDILVNQNLSFDETNMNTNEIYSKQLDLMEESFTKAFVALNKKISETFKIDDNRLPSTNLNVDTTSLTNSENVSGKFKTDKKPQGSEVVEEKIQNSNSQAKSRKNSSELKDDEIIKNNPDILKDTINKNSFIKEANTKILNENGTLETNDLDSRNFEKEGNYSVNEKKFDDEFFKHGIKLEETNRINQFENESKNYNSERKNSLEFKNDEKLDTDKNLIESAITEDVINKTNIIEGTIENSQIVNDNIIDTNLPFNESQTFNGTPEENDLKSRNLENVPQKEERNTSKRSSSLKEPFFVINDDETIKKSEFKLKEEEKKINQPEFEQIKTENSNYESKNSLKFINNEKADMNINLSNPTAIDNIFENKNEQQSFSLLLEPENQVQQIPNYDGIKVNNIFVYNTNTIKDDQKSTNYENKKKSVNSYNYLKQRDKAELESKYSSTTSLKIESRRNKDLIEVFKNYKPKEKSFADLSREFRLIIIPPAKINSKEVKNDYVLNIELNKKVENENKYRCEMDLTFKITTNE